MIKNGMLLAVLSVSSVTMATTYKSLADLEEAGGTRIKVPVRLSYENRTEDTTVSAITVVGSDGKKCWLLKPGVCSNGPDLPSKVEVVLSAEQDGQEYTFAIPLARKRTRSRRKGAPAQTRKFTFAQNVIRLNSIFVATHGRTITPEVQFGRWDKQATTN